MIAAILSPGLSLMKLSALPPCDLSIAINIAATMFAADWWATLDLPFIQEKARSVKGFPKLFTREEYQRATNADGTVEQLAQWCGEIRELALYTAPAAIVFAGFLGARRIDCYGCDMAGTWGADGIKHEARCEARWVRERALFDRATEFLKTKGVMVKRWT